MQAGERGKRLSQDPQGRLSSTQVPGGQRCGGFTLVELVLVIVLLGILSVGTLQYMQVNAGLYRESAMRLQTLSEARFVLERLSREIRQAHNASVRVSPDGQCLTFVPVLASGAYLGELAGQTAFTAVAARHFAADTSRAENTVSGDFIGRRLSVYSLPSSGQAFSEELYRADSDLELHGAESIARIQDYRRVHPDFAEVNITLERALQRDSPTRRYWILASPIQYCLKPAADSTAYHLYRYEGAGSTWLDYRQARPILMARQLAVSSRFEFDSINLYQQSVVGVHFDFLAEDGRTLSFNHRIQMRHVP